MVQQILRARGDPFGIDADRFAETFQTTDTSLLQKLRTQSGCDLNNCAARQSKAVIRIEPSNTHQTLDYVQPIQRIARFLDLATARESPNIVLDIRLGTEEIAIQRD